MKKKADWVKIYLVWCRELGVEPMPAPEMQTDEFLIKEIDRLSQESELPFKEKQNEKSIILR